MVRLFSSVLIAAILTGCGTTTLVANYPPPPKLERPVLESDFLTEDMPIDVLIQAYRVSIVKLKDYAKQLEKTLDSYRK
jgi:hypothetical protein